MKSEVRIGCHVGGGSSEVVKKMVNWEKQGLNVFQIFTGPPQKVSLTPPHSEFIEALREHQYVIHSPYWVSFFNPKVRNIYQKYLRYLVTYWLPKEGPLLFVTHTASLRTHSSEEMLMRIKAFLTPLVMISRGKVKICIENDAGNFSTKTPTVEQIARIKTVMKSTSIGLCLDTEHAYAAGEDLMSLPYEKADVIHLNSIPKYVKHGNHLDRHSFTKLRDSKIGTDFVFEIKKKIAREVPVILERRDPEIIMDDIGLYQRLEV